MIVSCINTDIGFVYFSKKQILKALVGVYKYNSVGDLNDRQRYILLLLQFK